MLDPSAALAVHQTLLEQWRGAMDLVGPGPLEPHFVDVKHAMRWLQARGKWADLGSGAGFPGIALAALNPDAHVTLVERRQKRAAFLETVVHEAKLTNATVLCGDAGALPPGSFDGVVARAFMPPQQLVAVAEGLLAPGGTLVLLLAKETPDPPTGWFRFHVEHYLVEGKVRRAEGWRLTNAPVS